MQRLSKWIATTGCVLILNICHHSAHGHGLVLPDAEYPYRVVDQDVNIVLKEFGQNLGIRVKLSPRVSGRVRGGLSKASASTFLNEVCRMSGLDWYYDGTVLHITSIEEQVTRFLTVNKDAAGKLTDTLSRLSFYDERFPIQVGPDNTSLVVSGPPGYVALVEQTLSSAHGLVGDMPRETLIYRGASVSVEKFAADSSR